jgi:hypothetical protein
MSYTSAAGTWTNDAGSQLILEEAEGILSGFYRTSIGAADQSKSYRVVGWQNGRCIGFTVSWHPESDSVTSWTALMDGEQGCELHSVWTLVRSRKLIKFEHDISERETAPWEAFSVQASRFRRVAQV